MTWKDSLIHASATREHQEPQDTTYCSECREKLLSWKPLSQDWPGHDRIFHRDLYELIEGGKECPLCSYNCSLFGDLIPNVSYPGPHGTMRNQTNRLSPTLQTRRFITRAALSVYSVYLGQRRDHELWSLVRTSAAPAWMEADEEPTSPYESIWITVPPRFTLEWALWFLRRRICAKHFSWH
jgi:hypothetical protein